MMGHLGLVVGTVLLATGLRYLYQPLRPATALSFFLIPPLLLVMTAVAIVVMGPHGHMVNWWEGWLCYGLAWGFIVALSWTLIGLFRETHRAQQQAQRHPSQLMDDAGPSVVAHVIASEAVFSAQVGLWQPTLVMSQGLLNHLSTAHRQAVLPHEAAHVHYRDTFWFFWLAGLRRLTRWLPYSDTLWQELLLLRELRADSWATQFVARLVLAEALVEAIAAPMTADSCAALSCAVPSRLSRRIDALLDEDVTAPAPLGTSLLQWTPLRWTELSFSLAPLLTIPFHH